MRSSLFSFRQLKRISNDIANKNGNFMVAKFFQIMDEVFILLIALSGEEL